MNVRILSIILTSTLAFSGVGVAAVSDPVPEGSMSFAMSGAYPPFNFVDIFGELQGFDVDISLEIANRLALEAEFVTTAFDTIVGGLQAKRYDTILGSLAITPEREEQVNFSDPYYTSGAQLVVRADSDINSPEDLSDARIAVVVGTTFEKEALKLPGVVDVVLYEGEEQTLQDLQIGRVDGVITDRLIGLYMIEEMGFDLKLAGDPLYEEVIAVALHKDSTELLASVNEALADMRDDGTYQEISEKWFGQDISY